MNTIQKYLADKIKGLFALLEHLSNKSKFMKFVSDYFKDFSEHDIVKSYSWFIALIVEEICFHFSQINPFVDGSVDEELCNGSTYPIYYKHLCNNSIKGKYLFIYMSSSLMNFFNLLV